MNEKKELIIGILVGIIMLILLGYMVFSHILSVFGVSKTDSNWDVKITNIKVRNITGNVITPSPPTYENLKATFTTTLTTDGNSIIYEVLVTNKGTIDAKLDKITLSDTNNPVIKFTTDGLKEGDVLLAKSEATLLVTVAYNDKTNPSISNTSNLTVNLDYVQFK